MTSPGADAFDGPRLDLDPFEEAFLTDPFSHHARIRDAGPAVWFDRYGMVGMGRYREVRQALDDWKTYCSSRGGGLTDFAREKPWRPPSIVLEADPPLHTRTRGVLSEVLSRVALEKLRAMFSARADVLVEGLVERGTFEAVGELAEAFPLSVFPDAVGITSSGRENLLPYGNMAFNAFGPRNELFEASFADAQRVSAWIAAQCERAVLDPDGFGARIYDHADAGTISEAEAGLLVRSLLTAGLDTTIFGIGAAIWCFGTYPAQWDRLTQTDTLARNAVGEVMRFMSPVQTFFRTTTRPVEVSGVHIGEGQKVLLFLASANRDPRQWDDPDTFDITRRTTGHVAFGHGIHMCVGQMLARMEMEIILTALACRVSAIEITGTSRWRLNNTLHGLDRLDVTIRPR